MVHNDSISEEIRERMAENEEIIREVRSDKALLEEIRYRILSKKLHNQLMDLVTEAVNSGNVQVESVEDLLALVELDLLLLT